MRSETILEELVELAKAQPGIEEKIRDRETQYNLKKYKITEISTENALPIYRHIVEKYPCPYLDFTRITILGTPVHGWRMNWGYSFGLLFATWKSMENPLMDWYSILLFRKTVIGITFPKSSISRNSIFSSIRHALSSMMKWKWLSGPMNRIICSIIWWVENAMLSGTKLPNVCLFHQIKPS